MASSLRFPQCCFSRNRHPPERMGQGRWTVDKGAHFYRCDFQVHTPRDQNWKGKDAVTAEERAEYAQSLVAYCRGHDLHAIAISDHHDMAFVPYVLKAAVTDYWLRVSGFADPERT